MVMNTIKFKNNEMMFFNMENFVSDVEGQMISVPSKKDLNNVLSKYCSANGMETVDFTWQSGGEMVTIWCHNQLGEGLTNVYLVGVMSKDCWLNCGWYEDTPNPKILHMDMK